MFNGILYGKLQCDASFGHRSSANDSRVSQQHGHRNKRWVRWGWNQEPFAGCRPIGIVANVAEPERGDGVYNGVVLGGLKRRIQKDTVGFWESEVKFKAINKNKLRYLNPATYIRPEHESFVDSESSRLLQEAEAEDGDAYISIPTLNLNAEAWSSNDLTYTHRKGDEKSSKEIIRKTEAFKEWLSAKMY